MLVVVDCFSPVWVLIAVIVAPGIRALEGSSTRPVKDADVDCAIAAHEQRRGSRNNNSLLGLIRCSFNRTVASE